MSIGNGQRDTRSIGALLSSITEDLSSLVRGEIALAKAEMAQSAKRAASGAALFAVAGVLTFLAVIFLLVALAYGLVEAGLEVWAGFLIVALGLLLITAILVAIGVVQFKKVRGAERAKQQTEATKRFLTTVPQRFKTATERSAAEAGFTAPVTPIDLSSAPAGSTSSDTLG